MNTLKLSYLTIFLDYIPIAVAYADATNVATGIIPIDPTLLPLALRDSPLIRAAVANVESYAEGARQEKLGFLEALHARLHASVYLSSKPAP